MANQEDSACEIPLKRPRLEGAESEDQVNQEVGKIDNEINKNTSAENNAATASVNTDTNPERPEQKNESVMSNNGSSSGEANRTTALDNSDSDNWSDISDLSGMSEDAWKPIAGPISWVQHQMTLGHNPREILQDLVTADTVIPPDLDDFTMWKIIINLMSEPPKRKKLHHINTLDDVLDLLKTCKKIMVLTGAGVSVSCGIPDFRSRNGIYARLAVDFPDLPDPQAMFDIRYFKNDPRPFFKFAKEIYPGQFEPSRCHKFIQLIEHHNKLLRNYTQNIDTLEQVAGISNVIQCHGSFAGATCMVCRHKVTAEDVKEDIFNQIIPACPVCPAESPMSILKPDIVFFGESLPDEFHRQMAEDKDECDLLIVIGSSLKVRPVALIPNSLPSTVPQILINREPLPHMNFDVELLGDCDIIISELCKRLGKGWSHLGDSNPPLSQIKRTDLATPLSLSASASQEDTTVSSKKTDSPTMLNSEVSQKSSVDSTVSEDISKETLKSETSSEVTAKETANSPSSVPVKETKSEASEDSTKETLKSQDTVNKTLTLSEVKETKSETSSEDTAKETTKSEVKETKPVSLEDTAKISLKSKDTVKETLKSETSLECTAKETLKSSSQDSHKETSEEGTAKDIVGSKESSSKESPIGQSSDISSNGQAVVSKDVSLTLNDKPEVMDTSRVAEVIENGSNKDKSLSETEDINGSANNGPSSASLLEMRKLWHSHERQSVAKRLKDDQFLFLPPCRYVFHGAEVANIEYESEESDQESLVSESRDLHTSQCGDEAGDGDTTLSHPHPDAGDGEGASDIKMFEGSSIADVVQESFSLT